ncbi:prepilin peptidase [Photobacterium sp. SDRW27]|uniref:A24 family peptidase n=1 Tax=Photobacterium obscurum TaxID=2829490 RepID=UPI0022441046|nr:prepilin peptidase [Photobacterium obscurum]MCW8327414.1 prepilin peptidase [Photobacterium obscurum]
MVNPLLLGVICIIPACFDICSRKIPNRLCVFILLLSLYISYQNEQFVYGIISGLTISIFGLIFFYFGILAAGDSKLAAALAAALLPGQLLNAVILTLLAGGVLAVFYLIKDRLILKKKPGEDRGLPYGVAISFGFYLTIVANSI